MTPPRTADNALPPLRAALVGTPNCGKTALFNALTGSRQKVANYAGVTVERKEGSFRLPGGRAVRLLDLPGTLGLRARSPDEAITRDVVLGRAAGESRPDVLIVVGDATNLAPTLRLVLELRQAGVPLLLAVNMMDIARARGLDLDLPHLGRLLEVETVACVAVRRGGTHDLLQALERFRPPVDHDAAAPSGWSEPNAETLRAWHGEAATLLQASIRQTGRPHGLTARLDAVLLHPVAGILILLAILLLMFQAVFAWAAPAMDAIEAGFALATAFVNAHMGESLFRSLLTDGILAGVGSVVVFLPQIVLLFAFIILLEDFGYMARAAFLMDRLMGGVGLHGRAFIPLLSSFACAIPGIMATRTIENPRDRLVTLLIAPLMTCSARLPVYTLIIGALIPEKTVGGIFGLQGLVMFGLYALGILGGLGVAFLFRRSVFRGHSEPFMLALPDYKLPDWKNLLIGVALRAQIFLRRAGTIIFALMVALWFLATFPLPPEGATDPAIHYSWAGRLGKALAPLMAPIGFSWEMTLALIPAMAAREVAVAALGTIYALGDGGEQSLDAFLRQSWPLPAALAFLVWFVFAPQCFSTLAVVRRETNRWLWPAVMFVYMTALAYGASFLTFHAAQALLG